MMYAAIKVINITLCVEKLFKKQPSSELYVNIYDYILIINHCKCYQISFLCHLQLYFT